jgi:hypothetical protein
VYSDAGHGSGDTQKLVIASQYANDFQALVTISRLRFHVCMAEPSWRIVST